MTRNHALLAAAEDLAPAISGHLTVHTEAQPARIYDIRARGGFARDFATADGERVMVAALTRQQFVDLARTTRLGRTFAFLERLLPADFSSGGDLYTHRATIAALLAPWFSRRTVADLAAAFAGTSVPWARLNNLADRPGSRR